MSLTVMSRCASAVGETTSPLRSPWTDGPPEIRWKPSQPRDDDDGRGDQPADAPDRQVRQVRPPAAAAGAPAATPQLADAAQRCALVRRPAILGRIVDGMELDAARVGVPHGRRGPGEATAGAVIGARAVVIGFALPAPGRGLLRLAHPSTEVVRRRDQLLRPRSSRWPPTRGGRCDTLLTLGGPANAEGHRRAPPLGSCRCNLPTSLASSRPARPWSPRTGPWRPSWSGASISPRTATAARSGSPRQRATWRPGR
jgi:hypothetical protein